jgi:hypothetical protein
MRHTITLDKSGEETKWIVDNREVTVNTAMGMIPASVMKNMIAESLVSGNSVTMVYEERRS